MQRLPDGGEVGPADALIMARSGLERVGLAQRIAYEFSAQEMLPAVGQGIVAVECALNDWETRRILSLIDDPAAHRSARRRARGAVGAQRSLQLADRRIFDDRRHPDDADRLGAGRSGGLFIEASRTGPADRPRELGRAVGLELLAKGAAEIIERSRPRCDLAPCRFGKHSRHHPRKRMIQYAAAFRFQYRPATTGYPPSRA